MYVFYKTPHFEPVIKALTDSDKIAESEVLNPDTYKAHRVSVYPQSTSGPGWRVALLVNLDQAQKFLA